MAAAKKLKAAILARRASKGRRLSDVLDQAPAIGPASIARPSVLGYQ
jgi:hypothetical protein